MGQKSHNKKRTAMIRVYFLVDKETKKTIVRMAKERKISQGAMIRKLLMIGIDYLCPKEK